MSCGVEHFPPYRVVSAHFSPHSRTIISFDLLDIPPAFRFVPLVKRTSHTLPEVKAMIAEDEHRSGPVHGRSLFSPTVETHHRTGISSRPPAMSPSRMYRPPVGTASSSDGNRRSTTSSAHCNPIRASAWQGNAPDKHAKESRPTSSSPTRPDVSCSSTRPTTGLGHARRHGRSQRATTSGR